MHFKLDENVPLQLEEFIKTEGHSASTVFSENISGIKDTDLLELCKEKNYSFVTLDSQGAKSAVQAFENLAKSFDLAKIANKIIIVEDKRI